MELSHKNYEEKEKSSINSAIKGSCSKRLCPLILCIKEDFLRRAFLDYDAVIHEKHAAPTSLAKPFRGSRQSCYAFFAGLSWRSDSSHHLRVKWSWLVKEHHLDAWQGLVRLQPCCWPRKGTRWSALSSSPTLRRSKPIILSGSPYFYGSKGNVFKKVIWGRGWNAGKHSNFFGILFIFAPGLWFLPRYPDFPDGLFPEPEGPITQTTSLSLIFRWFLKHFQVRNFVGYSLLSLTSSRYD